MSLRHVEKDFNRRGLKGLAKAIAGIRQDFSDRTGEKDISFPESMKKPQRASEIESQTPDPLDLLRQTVQELNRNSFSPEAVTNFQQAFWQIPRGEEGFTFDMTPCTATKEQLRKPIVDVKGRKLLPLTIGIPEELKGKEGLIRLGKMFPELGNYSVKEGTPIQDEFDKTGYIRVEGVVDAPNLDTNEDQLREHFDSQGVRGQRLITYVIASRQMKVLKDKYPDQGPTWSRLIGSRCGGGVVHAFCFPDGRLGVFRYLFPRNHCPVWGGRSEEVL